ncbi:MAG: ParB/RepB/Spo0J family partition protein [Chloroflexota bacterium]|nr:ParB/RepB/Spo0J family partition protein [Chloroflexota bacterium]
MESIIDVRFTEITVDPELQPRVEGLDLDHVRALEEGVESWPPISVVPRQGGYLLIDGYHRLAAAQNLRLDTIRSQVLAQPEDGDLVALTFSLNAVHGRPLSLADRRAFAARSLQRRPEVSNLEVSRRAGLAPTTIAAIRQQLEAADAIYPVEQRVGRDGQSYTVPVRDREPGELPKLSMGEQVGNLFSANDRKQHRRIVQYLQRLGVALGDLDELAWETADELTEACRLVLGDERAAALAGLLGPGAAAVLTVAEALGYEDQA